MFVPSLLKIYFGLGWQNRLLKKRFGLSNGQKGNELRLWDGKKIICKCSLKKKYFKTIIIPWDISVTKVENKLLQRLQATYDLLTFRPTAILDLRQLFIFVLFEE